MSKNGVRQLTKLTALYSDVGKSSQGLRDFIFKDGLKEFQAHSPGVKWGFAVTREGLRDSHPKLVASYADGSRQVMPLKNVPVQGVQMRAWQLRNQVACNPQKHRNRHLERPVPSIQGSWNPYLWLHDGPAAPDAIEDEMQAAQAALARSQTATRREQVYRDVLKHHTIKQGYVRRSVIRASAHLERPFAPPPMDADQKRHQKRWSGQ